SMGCAVVAEKIEEKSALEILIGMGVAYGQGYFLHRPEPLEAIVARATGQPAPLDRPEFRLSGTK
ncbi:EAL domain-containing protein, partial [Mesorhizobium sp. USDA-HM6]